MNIECLECIVVYSNSNCFHDLTLTSSKYAMEAVVIGKRDWDTKWVDVLYPVSAENRSSSK